MLAKLFTYLCGCATLCVIFLKKYDTPHGLTLGMSYSRALDKLGLHTFWAEHTEFINKHKLDEVDLIKKELREGKYNG